MFFVILTYIVKNFYKIIFCLKFLCLYNPLYPELWNLSKFLTPAFVARFDNLSAPTKCSNALIPLFSHASLAFFITFSNFLHSL